MIGIINYGAGNISAISNQLKHLKVDFKIINVPNDFVNLNKVILPGVGAFDYCMKKLESSGLIEPLNKHVLIEKKDVLGICVGMQLMAKSSEEGNHEGLGWFNAEVKKFNEDLIVTKPKLPHMGWNSIKVVKENQLFKDVDTSYGFYFVHSYYFDTLEKDDIMTETFYGSDFTSSISKNNIFAVQFHPEKSHSNGIKFLRNFIDN